MNNLAGEVTFLDKNVSEVTIVTIIWGKVDQNTGFMRPASVSLLMQLSNLREMTGPYYIDSPPSIHYNK